MELDFLKPEGEYAHFVLHKTLYSRLENALQHVWESFPKGCERLCLLTDEIVDNRFLHNSGTKNVKVRLNIDANGRGRLRIYNDGAPYNDMTDPRHSEVVVTMIRNLEAEYLEAEDGGETPIVVGLLKVCRTIKIQLRN